MIVPVLATVLAAVLIAASGVATRSLADSGPNGATTTLSAATQLYRKYCGQCHALKSALAAGFGTLNGLGTNGGPSFNNLRISAPLCVLALTVPFIGHEILVRKLNWSQIEELSRYLATVTKNHPVAGLPTDG
jgi:hypothetical protein